VLARIEQIAAVGPSYMCAREREGRVHCWQSDAAPQPIRGLPPSGELVQGASCAFIEGEGNESEGAESGPVATAMACWRGDPPTAAVMKGVLRIRGYAAGPGADVDDWDTASACWLDRHGAVRCWGVMGIEWYYDDKRPHQGPSLWMPSWQARPLVSRDPRPIAGGTGIKELSESGCALRADGTVGLLTIRCGKGPRCSTTIASPEPPLRGRIIIGSGCYVKDATGAVTRLEAAAWYRPTPPPAAIRTSLRDVRYVDDAEGVACAVMNDQTARCDLRHDGSFAALLTDEPTISASTFHGSLACAHLANDQVRCRSIERGAFGPLEDPLSRGTAVPLAVFP
jgi:hypothetical protein